MRILKKYFDSSWIPFVSFLIVSFLTTIVSVLFRDSFLSILLLRMIPGLFFVGILVASIWNFTKRRWRKGILNLLFFISSIVIPILLLGLAMSRGTSEDKFADSLTIPDNIEISVPKNWEGETLGTQEDEFQKSLLAALEVSGSDDSSITVEVTSLVQLKRNAPDIIKRYFATSPCWRLFSERGNLYATRRWMLGSQWRYSLHGYYGNFDDEHGTKDKFQTRLTVGFSGKPWSQGSKTTYLKEGQSVNLKLSEGNQMNESHCVINADGLFVEVFEQSKAKERRLTKAALSYLEQELSPLLQQPTWDKIKGIIPSNSIKNGESSIQLWNSFQPGLYDSEIWVNPGEHGMIYLKAFEVTKNYPLSVDSLKEYSNEWVGWSDNPNELFFSNTHFTIYEGDWGKPYAARFEVWFVPDSGALERKLLEKIFKIEGWQR